MTSFDPQHAALLATAKGLLATIDYVKPFADPPPSNVEDLRTAISLCERPWVWPVKWLGESYFSAVDQYGREIRSVDGGRTWGFSPAPPDMAPPEPSTAMDQQQQVTRLLLRVAHLESLFVRLRDASDSEMGDGDLARNLAKEALQR